MWDRGRYDGHSVVVWWRHMSEFPEWVEALLPFDGLTPAEGRAIHQHLCGGGMGTSKPPAEALARKHCPVATGVLDYFPDALRAIAEVSYQGNEQHNPGSPLHWDRAKSTDEADALIRHFLQRGTSDTDGMLHSAKMAWRALALLQKELERVG